MTTLKPQPINQASTSPTTKVAAGGTAGAFSVVLVYALGLVHQVPAEVGSALTVIFTFLAGDLVKERRASTTAPDEAGA
jgi:hypothetical protein